MKAKAASHHCVLVAEATLKEATTNAEVKIVPPPLPSG